MKAAEDEDLTVIHHIGKPVGKSVSKYPSDVASDGSPRVWMLRDMKKGCFDGMKKERPKARLRLFVPGVSVQ
ncbi:MAG: hypothetical protein WDA27_14425 [Actinomycetota bacterium]